MTLAPYLLFDGTCRAALEAYQSVFGGELTLTSVGDSPMKAQLPPALHARILHADLKSPAVALSASDWLHPTRKPVVGNTVCLFLRATSQSELAPLFEALSPGATVVDPLTPFPFGAYGALTDRFGVRWMFHAER